MTSLNESLEEKLYVFPQIFVGTKNIVNRSNGVNDMLFHSLRGLSLGLAVFETKRNPHHMCSFPKVYNQ
jgi:hypothetical protein